MSPYYVGLNPGPDHLALALRHLLLANDWLPITLIVDDSLRAQKIKRVVQQQIGSTPSDPLIKKVRKQLKRLVNLFSTEYVQLYTHTHKSRKE